MPTGEPRDWCSPELWEPNQKTLLWTPLTEPIEDFIIQPAQRPHECKLAYVHVYQFLPTQKQYLKHTVLRCNGCEAKDLLVSKQIGKLPEYY